MSSSAPSRGLRGLAPVSTLALALALGAVAAPAFAQSAPAEKPAKKDDKKDDKGAAKVDDVTVTVDNSRTRTSIDRRSYDITKDLQATTGSIADALRSVPSVQVDMDGNISIRGDGNVTIWVDGKPSSMFQGGGSGQALQTIPAGQFERVEVITNPSASASPDGSAGIINLVTKKSAKPGSFGSVRLSVAPDGRAQGGFNFNRRAGKWTLSMNAGGRIDKQENDSYGRSTSYDAFGAPTVIVNSRGHREGNGGGGFGRIAVDYDLDPKTRLSASLMGFRGNGPGDSVSTRIAETPGGVITSNTVREGTADFAFGNTNVDATFRHSFAGEQHDIVVRVATGSQTQDNDSTTVTHNLLPASADVYDRRNNSNVVRMTTVNADYQRPIGDNMRLKVGYEGRFEDNSYSTAGFLAQPTPTAPNSPGQTNLFEAKRDINAVYASYEQTIGQFTWLAGLRYETSHFDLNQVTSGITNERTDSRFYPTLHLGWAFDDKNKLVFSYSQRIQRPDPQQFNPFVVIYSPFSLSTGNPNLDPQRTDSYELRYDRQEAQRNYAATLFYRENTAGVATQTIDIGGGVYLSRPVNMGSSTATGLELSAGGKLGTKFSFNVGGDVSYVDVDPLPAIGAPARSGWVVNGNASLNWQVTPKDLLQVNASSFGGQVTSSGEIEPFALLNLGYRHKFNDQWALIATVRDAADSFRSRTTVDTARVRSFNENRNNAQTVFVGFQWNFGRGPRRDNQQFDYGGGPGS